MFMSHFEDIFLTRNETLNETIPAPPPNSPISYASFILCHFALDLTTIMAYFHCRTRIWFRTPVTWIPVLSQILWKGI